MRTHVPFALLATALACSVFAAPAHALRARVFVSKAGADVGACSFSAPCQSLGYALSGVEPNGEITILDSGGYSSITITQGITITVPPGVEAGIAAAAGGAAITINAPGATVVLRGLTLEGAGSANWGIYSYSAALLEIIDCTVGNFTTQGIIVEAPAVTSVMISNTVVSDVSPGGAEGIFLVSTGGAMIAALNQVTVTNSSYGVAAYASNGTIEAQISNSHIDNNTSTGVSALGGGPSSMSNVVLENVTVNQTPTGIAVQAYSAAWFSHVTVASVPGFTSVAGVQFSGGNNQALSDGTSHLGLIAGGISIGTWGFQ